MKHVIVKSVKDNVGNALEDIAPGDEVSWEAGGENHTLRVGDAVPFAFKMALRAIAEGADIVCYGEPVGEASADIAPGACVHIHNVRGRRGNA